jgi:hypothetical protein
MATRMMRRPAVPAPARCKVQALKMVVTGLVNHRRTMADMVPMQVMGLASPMRTPESRTTQAAVVRRTVWIATMAQGVSSQTTVVATTATAAMVAMVVTVGVRAAVVEVMVVAVTPD